MMQVKHLQLLLVLLISIDIIFCGNKDSLKSPEIEITPNFPPLNVRDLCNGLFFEARPLPGNENFFIGCIKGEGVILQCDMNNIFDPETVKCIHRDDITTTTQEITSTTPDYNSLCAGLNFDFVNHPTDCGMVIFCFEGRPILRECPENTIFDVILGNCRSGDRETCEFFETTTTSIQTTTERNLSGICEGLDRVFLEFPNDCRKAIYCFNGNALVSQCRENTIFDINIGDCRYGNPETCEFYSSTTALPDYNALCEGREHEFLNHPTNCAKFIFCHNESPIVGECPEDTIFDLSRRDCKEGNKETCEYSKEERCKDMNNVFIAHENDPSRYYHCKSGIAFSMICDNNQVFDADSTACRMRQRLVIFFTLFALCSEIAEAQSNPCSGVWSGVVPHPDICYKYYRCLLQIPTEQTCGPNQIFDPDSYSCIPGNQETCEPYVETTTFISPTNSTSTTTQPIFTTTIPETTTQSNFTTTTTPETTTPGPSLPDIPTICRNVFFAARPYPDSDFLYIGCIRGSGIIYQCFENEEFDPKINECVEKCEVSENICVGDRAVRVIGNPCDCASYVVCYMERIVEIAKCGESQIFDENFGDCRPGDPSTCEFTKKFFY